MTPLRETDHSTDAPIMFDGMVLSCERNSDSRAPRVVALGENSSCF